MKNQILFSEDMAYARLDKLGDPLAKLDEIIDWTPLVKVIEEVRPNKTRNGVGGRPPIASRILLKCLLLGEFYNLSDEALEYALTVRIDFIRFAGIAFGEKAPDRNTFWLLKEALKDSGKHEDLFRTFWEMLERAGIVYSKGTIVDATFIEAPKRRVTKREENERLKNGEIPERFSNPRTATEKHRASQTDVDARWTQKGGVNYFGYKDHVAADAETKLIVSHEVTDASVHDSRKLVEVAPLGTKVVYDDAGYAGKEIDEKLRKKLPDVKHYTCARNYRNKPLTDGQKAENRSISKVRVRVEHVFGRMTSCMGGLTVRCIGMSRAKCQITLRDLAYNIQRYATMVRYGKADSMQAIGACA
jgi:IS5 family transposase